MKIAIIESDNEFIRRLIPLGNTPDWDMEYYSDSVHFSQADLKSLNVVIASNELLGISGKELFKSIHTKTPAELYLMSDTMETFCEKDIQNELIKGLIKKNPKAINVKLQYIESKFRITQLAKTGANNFNSILDKANGYSFKEKDDIEVIELQTFLSEESMSTLFERVTQSNNDKIIVSYPGGVDLQSIHCGQLLNIYKFLKQHDRKTAFCNTDSNESVRLCLHGCKLDKIVPVFNEMNGAVAFLHDT